MTAGLSSVVAVDEVKIYTKALTKDDLARDCGCEILPPPPQAISHFGLEAYFSFDTRSAEDQTGHRYNGRWEGNENYAEGKPGKMMAASFDGSSRIVVDSFTNMAFGSQFSVSLFFERTGGQQNYQGIVNNGYYKSGSFEIRMGREMGGEMLGGGVSRALGSPYGY